MYFVLSNGDVEGLNKGSAAEDLKQVSGQRGKWREEGHGRRRGSAGVKAGRLVTASYINS